MHAQAQYLANLSRDFPTAWRLCDEYRASRGHNRIPEWPLRCFLPFAIWGKIALELSKRQETDWGKWQDFIRLATYGAWRPTQGIYQFAPALYDTITDTHIDDTIPAEVLLRLPEWCMYIAPPGLTHCGKQFDVFFVPMNYYMNSDEVESYSPLRNNFGLSLKHESKPLKRPSLRKALSTSRTKESAVSLGVSSQVQQHLEGIIFDEPAVLKMLNLVLNLCSTNLELNSSCGETSPRTLPTPQRNRTGFRLYPPDAPTIWRVGENLSRQIAEAQKQASSESAEHKIHNSPRSHVRRAHWHGFWSGPRKPSESSNDNARKFAVKWLPPISVTLGNEVRDE